MGGMQIQCFRHVSFEGPGWIADWVEERRHRMEVTRFYESHVLPDMEKIDLLIIMGGPMNVFDSHIYPWLEAEIEWVRKFIASDKPVLGICLGAQIIAASLGAEVYPGKEKEIGWYDVRFLPCLGDYKICPDLPGSRKVFHWHGDTFDIPSKAVRIAESKAFPNQGFLYFDRVLALQFHLELGPENVRELVKHCRDELVPGPYIQTEEELLHPSRFDPENRMLLYRFLDFLVR